MKFKKFIKASFLKGIGRDLLGRFFAPFAAELAEKKIEIPAASVKDEEFYMALSKVAMAPDGLPDGLIEAVFKVEAMATADGQERLEKAAEQGRFVLNCSDKSSHGDIAVQAFLAAPEVLAEKHNELLLTRLSSFEYFSSKKPVDRSASFVVPSQVTLDLVTADLDAWFKAHSRGEQTTWIEIFPMDGEFWFLVRHGDTFARTAKVDKRKMEMLHFRPAKDDVVVFSPQRDEIRIHAGTKGERELYQETFGVRLFGDPRYFSERKAYTLEPLRADQADALDTAGIGGIERIVLREFVILWPGGFNEVVTRRADDIFSAAQARGKIAIPDGGRLLSAAFDFYFEGAKKPRKVELRPPNVLKLGRHCDAGLVHQWLSAKHLRDGLIVPEAKAA